MRCLALWIAFACLCLSTGVVGDQLYGGGSSSVVSLFTTWAANYPYNTDSVSIGYSEADTATAQASYELGLIDFVSLDSPVNSSTLAGLRSMQLPIAGGAIVVSYNLAGYLTPGVDALYLDLPTLAAIWMGSITSWNDSRIASLNTPAVAALLPSLNIELALRSTSSLGLNAVFARALSAVDPSFSAALAAAGGHLEGLANNAVVFPNTTSALTSVKATVGSMTISSWAAAKSAGTTFASMVNRAGKKVAPSTASVQAAMYDYRAIFDSGAQAADIFNGNGTASWPLAYLQYVVLNKNVSTLACSPMQNLLLFLSWTQMNDYAISLSNAQFFPALVTNLQKLFVDSLETVGCSNGAQALQTAVLLGVGSPQPLFSAWASSYPSSTFLVKYYQQTTTAAVTEMTAQDVDFGVTAVGLTDAESAAMPDVVLFPAVASPVVPAYNLPELLGKPPLVLNFQILSDIYLAHISHWNDSAIAALNPGVTLPNQPIYVIVQNMSSVSNFLATSALAGTVPEFNTTVGAGYQVNFPVANTSRCIVTPSTNVPDLLAANRYSFAFWSYYPVLQKRVLQSASLVNLAGTGVVSPGTKSVASALNDFGASTKFTNLLLGKSNESWPIATVISVMVLRTQMKNCDKAAALADWILWTQTSTLASQVAGHFGQTTASMASVMKKIVLTELTTLTCDGIHVSSVHGCVKDGVLCNDVGTCVNQACVCNSGWTGEFCQEVVSSSSGSSDLALPIALAVIIPIVVLLVLLLAIFFCCLLFFVRKSRVHDDWSINFEELELQDLLGAGGYGEVYRAVWKGTEVAVKVMSSKDVTKDMERNFREEVSLMTLSQLVRVMTALRHPNVVLFMAACTKPPKMCIVMEYMALGSLYDLLHNELVPELPFALICKIAYQAAKGMHFLHSSGIVHRDLKSLNLLLDNKWNVKVGDFGLTKFKGQLGKSVVKDVQGTVQWLAPEVLQEAPEIDYILADVYSFGIILWETLTREQPYYGMTPAGVAVAVIRDNIRPPIPAGAPPEYAQLVADCWHVDPTIRPTFLEVMNRLVTMSGSSLTQSSHSSTASSSSIASGPKDHLASWIVRAGKSSDTSSDYGSASSKSDPKAPMGGRLDGTAEHAPRGEVAIVFSDITCSATLWEFDPSAMRDATILHNEIARDALKRHNGYEVVAFSKDSYRNSGEGSFCLAFQHIEDALEWCMDVQAALLHASWPESLLKHPGAAEEGDERTLFNGPRVRMGVAVGNAKTVRDPMTRRLEYLGPVVNHAAFLTSRSHGGQVLLSAAAHEKARETPLGKERKRIIALGTIETPDSGATGGERVYELKIRGLEGRFFGGAMMGDASSTTGTGTSHSGSGRADRDDDWVEPTKTGDDEYQMTHRPDVAYHEDNFLTSANLCRWIINFEDIQMGRQVGLGSYGVVYRGRWKGVEVAVKRFIKQKLDERCMLEFRAEMAFLSQLHHPNIVLFIGACVKRPNLCIVTEFVHQGALKDILHNPSIKLPYQQKLRILHSAASGIGHLHSLEPAIIHRDLKPSNLLVDENWNVKVADFGFARIKEENATMTRCGTPCWTAPEVLRGEKYSESADVYSFGIIMWEVLTRKQPYAGLNFMSVSLDVLEGRRPKAPTDCPSGM